MAAIINSRIVWIVPLLMAVCLAGVATSAQTSTYVFVPDQSKVVQTGGIASVHWTYSVKGQFELTVDPNVGTASFAHVDANATDDSPFKRTLDPNHVFNMTSLVGTVEPSGLLKFTGKAPDDSDVSITVTLQDGLAHLIGQTTPPPNSADFFIFSLDAVAQLRKYGGGSGTADNPYQIATAEDLMLLGDSPEDYDKHFILTADIDLDPNLPGRKVFDRAVVAPDTNDYRWYEFDGSPFTGVFNGEGHKISNLTLAGMSYVGLFGYIGSGASISNLNVEAVNIHGGSECGGLAGYNSGDITDSCCTGRINAEKSLGRVGGLVGYNDHGGSITASYSTGTVSGGESRAGGLVGDNNGIITASYSASTTQGNGHVGGLVGYNDDEGSIAASYSTGPVSGDGHVGGLAGSSDGNIAESYSTGTVSGRHCVGGLIGSNGGNGNITSSYSTGVATGTQGSVGGLAGQNWGSIATSYSTGRVSGDWSVGGLVGYNDGSIATSFWDIETSGLSTSNGGTGKTTAEMHTARTFLEAGWDFVNVWGIGENQTYPYLRKYSTADINQDGSINFLDLAALAENWLGDFD